jgi:hypothetical protein
MTASIPLKYGLAAVLVLKQDTQPDDAQLQPEEAEP